MVIGSTVTSPLARASGVLRDWCLIIPLPLSPVQWHRNRLDLRPLLHYTDSVRRDVIRAPSPGRGSRQRPAFTGERPARRDARAPEHYGHWLGQACGRLGTRTLRPLRLTLEAECVAHAYLPP
jgi:hypothetical protein